MAVLELNKDNFDEITGQDLQEALNVTTRELLTRGFIYQSIG